MLRFIFPAIMCVALCCPMVATAQDCGGCGATPAAAMEYSVMAAPAMEAAPMMAAPMMAASDCGCNAAPAPCQKTRKKLQRVCVDQQVATFNRVCTTDACGCSKSKLVRSCKTVKVNKLQLVDVPVDPCKQRGGRLKGMLGKLRSSMSNNNCCPAPAPSCGCAAPAPAPCGCN